MYEAPESIDTQLLRQILAQLQQIRALLAEAPMTAESSPTLLAADLAKILRCSTSTIKARVAHAPHLLPPQMARVDRRPRWSAEVVKAWLNETERDRRGWRSPRRP